MTASQACELIAATRHAMAIGLPFNRHITIHWEEAGIADSGAAQATAHFLKLLRKWNDRRGLRVAFIWVRENGIGKGSHAHILAHIPTGAALRYHCTKRWLESITGKPYRRGAILTRRIGGTVNVANSNPAAHLKALGVVLGYDIKGVTPETASAIGLERQTQDGGCIIGKRCGTSQNIGAKARKAWPVS